MSWLIDTIQRMLSLGKYAEGDKRDSGQQANITYFPDRR